MAGQVQCEMALATVESPVGLITLASCAEGLSGLWIAGQKHHGRTLGRPVADGSEHIERAQAWLKSYFAGEAPTVDVALAPAGSEFQMLVWEILGEIPYGQLTTYGDIAREVAERRGGRRTSALAVGGAVGRNPISIIVPCHRVVGAGGNLTGYAGGLHIKRALLELEGVDMSGLYAPKKGTAL